MAGAPKGNQNARRENRLLTNALRRELAQYQADGVPPGEAASRVAQTLIRNALAGEPWAIKELYDRVDGKPAQSVELTGDPDNPVQTVQRVERHVINANTSD